MRYCPARPSFSIAHLFVALVFGLASAPAFAQETALPNIVVVLVDDLRWDEIGAAGHPYVETPAYRSTRG